MLSEPDMSVHVCVCVCPTVTRVSACAQELLVAAVINLLFWKMPRNTDYVEDRKTLVSVVFPSNDFYVNNFASITLSSTKACFYLQLWISILYFTLRIAIDACFAGELKNRHGYAHTFYRHMLVF